MGNYLFRSSQYEKLLENHEEEDAMESDSHKIVYELRAPPCMHGPGFDQQVEFFENKVNRRCSGPYWPLGGEGALVG